MREEPVLFLRAKEDFVPYTPRDKQSLPHNLQGLGPGVPAESLELAIRKEVRPGQRARRSSPLWGLRQLDTPPWAWLCWLCCGLVCSSWPPEPSLPLPSLPAQSP